MSSIACLNLKLSKGDNLTFCDVLFAFFGQLRPHIIVFPPPSPSQLIFRTRHWYQLSITSTELECVLPSSQTGKQSSSHWFVGFREKQNDQPGSQLNNYRTLVSISIAERRFRWLSAAPSRPIFWRLVGWGGGGGLFKVRVVT